MKLIETLGLKALHQFDPERAHGLSIKALNMGLAPKAKVAPSPRLRTSVAGLDFANPVGLAAGYDKNAQAVMPLAKCGFGFLEVGAATPRPQPGNPKPRLFRLTPDQGVINRFGFNNEGVDVIADRLAAVDCPVPLGLNLGANKDSADRTEDYSIVLRRAAPHLGFATVNVSSPNTEKLRDLQGKAALEALLGRVMETNQDLDRPLPIFLKIAPDLTDAEILDVADVAKTAGLSAIIATNTTLDRDGLASAHADEMGGLSGAPLFEKSTRVLAKLSEATSGDIPLIGVGGIGSAAQAYAKIKAGASLVQVYSAMVYKGISLISDITIGLDQMLAQDGFDRLEDAVDTDRAPWL